jgi:hypothetical protein
MAVGEFDRQGVRYGHGPLHRFRCLACSHGASERKRRSGVPCAADRSGSSNRGGSSRKSPASSHVSADRAPPPLPERCCQGVKSDRARSGLGCLGRPARGRRAFAVPCDPAESGRERAAVYRIARFTLRASGCRVARPATQQQPTSESIRSSERQRGSRPA